MNKQSTDQLAEEQSLVKLYAEITGTNESCARGVFMYLTTDAEETSEPSNVSGTVLAAH